MKAADCDAGYGKFQLPPLLFGINPWFPFGPPWLHGLRCRLAFSQVGYGQM